MASEIKLPELGENLTEGDVLDVRIAPGDVISQGQTLIEVEAEKSTVEVPSPLAGRVAKLFVKKGDKIHVGQAVCLVESNVGATEEPVHAAAGREAAHADAESEVTHAEDAKRVAAERAEESRPAKRNGIRAEAKAPVGDGQHHETPAPPQKAAPSHDAVPAGPATRRLARQLGVDLHEVQGSAPGGRVTPEDIKAHVRDRVSAPTSRGPGMQPPSLPDFERWGPIERRPMDAVRRKTAEQMSLAWSLIPHVTQHDQADITELEAFRKQQEGKGPKLTITAFALKASAIALQQFPQFNASVDVAGGLLVLKRYYHVGIAVDTERGLLVPVLRDVDKKSVQQLAEELTAVAERTRQRKIQGDELRGGTFTITNLGGIGGTGFTPIINYPEVAILGLSRGRLQPVVHNGQIVPRLLLPLSLSYDHRIIDGADAARFTRRIAEMLENPLVMLLHA
ncbi:MAG TPA: dihydrolipoamide acetyltransferase family protein [Gemmataceae bacterium]|nr:dihydrolipoamide acetyltransferase family protein [Gemmataceae bacterium]